MEVVKIAGRMIKVLVKGVRMPDGSIVNVTELAPDQGLGESCHQISRLVAPSNSVETKTWQDDPDDIEEVEQWQEQATGLSM